MQLLKLIVSLQQYEGQRGFWSKKFGSEDEKIVLLKEFLHESFKIDFKNLKYRQDFETIDVAYDEFLTHLEIVKKKTPSSLFPDSFLKNGSPEANLFLNFKKSPAFKAQSLAKTATSVVVKKDSKAVPIADDGVVQVTVNVPASSGKQSLAAPSAVDTKTDNQVDRKTEMDSKTRVVSINESESKASVYRGGLYAQNLVADAKDDITVWFNALNNVITQERGVYRNEDKTTYDLIESLRNELLKFSPRALSAADLARLQKVMQNFCDDLSSIIVAKEMEAESDPFGSYHLLKKDFERCRLVFPAFVEANVWSNLELALQARSGAVTAPPCKNS